METSVQQSHSIAAESQTDVGLELALLRAFSRPDLLSPEFALSVERVLAPHGSPTSPVVKGGAVETTIESAPPMLSGISSPPSTPASTRTTTTSSTSESHVAHSQEDRTMKEQGKEKRGARRFMTFRQLLGLLTKG